MNIRQERFAELVASGVPASRAYPEAGYSNRGKNAAAHASRLVENGGVSARIAELRKPVTKKLPLTKDRKREILRDIAEDTERPTMVRLRAVEIDSRLAGHFEPDRVEMDTGPSLLETTRERALAIVSALVRNRDVLGNPAIVRDAPP